jgi:hypothetical protein
LGERWKEERELDNRSHILEASGGKYKIIHSCWKHKTIIRRLQKTAGDSKSGLGNFTVLMFSSNSEQMGT